MGLFANLFSKQQNKITPIEAYEIINGSDPFILLDVRAPAEFKQVRIDGAKLLTVDEIVSRAPIELPNKQIPILIYCHSGIRAGIAADLLTRMGYTKVLSFGGIINWPYKTITG